jgi:hypothetical protein
MRNVPAFLFSPMKVTADAVVCVAVVCVCEYRIGSIKFVMVDFLAP